MWLIALEVTVWSSLGLGSSLLGVWHALSHDRSQAAESTLTSTESPCHKRFYYAVISWRHVYTHFTTHIHLKCTLLKPFGLEAQGVKMNLASHCFFSRQFFSISKTGSEFILICISLTWHSLRDPGCSFLGCRDRLSRGNTGGNFGSFKGEKWIQWVSAKRLNIHVLHNAGTSKAQAGWKKSKILKQIILKIIN